MFQIDAVVRHNCVSQLGSQFRVGKGGFDLERGKAMHGTQVGRWVDR